MRIAIAIAAAAAIGLAGTAMSTPASAGPPATLQPLVHDGSASAGITDVQFRRHAYRGHRHAYRGHRHAYPHHYPRRHRDRAGVALGAGVLGLALGAALATPRAHYYEPYPYAEYHAGPVPPYGYGWPDVEDPASGQDRHFQ